MLVLLMFIVSLSGWQIATAPAAAGTSTPGVGGPVILMGLDSEAGAGSSGHGPPAEHAAMVQSLLDAVQNGGEGILVIGPESSSRVFQYWVNDIGARVDEDVTFVSGVENILVQDFDGFAMIGVASSTVQITTGGLTDAENEALIQRDLDIAEFVNGGGGLLGKTQDRMSNPFGYVGPLGTFEPLTSANGVTQYTTVQVTEAGEELGLTTDGMSGWCCWHDVFPDFPDFMDVLVTHNSGGTYQGYAAAVGGVGVTIPTGLELAPATEALAVGETHVLTATVTDDDASVEGIEVTFTVTAGPHQGTTGTADTNEDGHATFSYDGTAEGSDSIQATFVDSLDRLRTSNTVTAEWTEPVFVEECVDLIAAQSITAGAVCVSNDDDNLHVTYTTYGNWTLMETHLAVSSDDAGEGQWSDNRWTNRSGNPAPGRFPNQSGHDPQTDTTFTYTIPLDELGVAAGETVTIGAHAVVTDDWDDETGVGTTETAWGAGDRFVDRGNWAMHFGYDIQ